MKLILALAHLLMLTSCLNKIGVAKFDREDGAFLFSDLSAQSITPGSSIVFDINTVNGGDTYNGKNISYECSYDNTTDGIVSSSASDCSLLSISFNASTGKFSWTPTAPDAGTYEIKITASAAGESKELIFEVVVAATDSAPTISTIVRKTGEDNPTNNTTIVYTINFSEAVTNVDAADFSLTTTGTASGNILSVTSISVSQYEVTVDTVTGDGTIRLNLLDGNIPAIQDSANQALSNIPFSTGQTFTIDNTGATVSSINRLSTPNPTTAASVTFTVTFDASVTGVDTTDFALSTTGTVAANIASVAGGPASYTVTVDTITGDGTLRLDLNDADNDIVDSLGNILVSATHNGDQTFTIDNFVDDPSGVALFSPASSPGSDATPTLTVSDVEIGATVALFSDATCLSQLATGTAVATSINLTSSALLDGSGYNIYAKQTDSLGNTSSCIGPVAYTVDLTAPSLDDIVTLSTPTTTNADSVTFTVTFDQAVSNISTDDFSLTTTGTVSANIASVSAASGTSITVTVDTIAGDGTLRLDLNDADDDIADSAGNILTDRTVNGSGVFTIDNTAPAVSSIVSKVGDANPTSGTSARFTVTFSEAVTPVVAADFSLSTTGTAAHTSFTVTSVSSTVYDITVNGITGAGDIRLNLADANSSIRDAGNNALSPNAQNGDEWITMVNPVEVSNLTAKVKGGSIIELSWTGDATYYDSYVIAYNYGTTPPADCTSSDEFIPHTSITGTSHTLTGLGNTWDYAFRVCATYTDGSFPTAGVTINKKLILSDIGGNFFNLMQNNGYLYITNTYDSLINIYSVATDEISTSTWVNSITTFFMPSTMFVEGNYLYIASLVSELGIDLAVYDISDPVSPTLAATYITPQINSANKMIKDGDYLYIIDGTNLLIFDATNPLAISWSSTTALGLGAMDLLVYGNTIHIAALGSNFLTIDVTDKLNPGAPVPYTISAGAGNCLPMKLARNANIIFATCNDGANYGVAKYDADNLAGPTEFYAMATEPQSLKLTTNHFYVSDSTIPTPVFNGGDIHVVAQNDLSTSVATILSPPNGGQPMAIYNNNRLLFSSVNHLHLYDITTPATPSQLDSFSYTASFITGMGFDFTNEKLVISSMFDMYLVDISDLSAPVTLGTIPFVAGNFGHNAFIRNDYVYIPYAGTMSVYDVSDPLNPIALPSLVTSSTSFGSYNYFDNTSDDYLIIAYNDASYGVYDISNPASITEVHHAASAYSIGTYYLPLTVSNGHIYVAIDDDTIGVINLGTLTQVATIDIAAGQLANANINGTTLYLSDSTDTITVVDITTPAAPSILGTYAHTAFLGVMSGMNSVANKLILHFVYGSMEILDISSPIPTPFTTLENVNGYGYGFSWSDDDVNNIGYFCNLYGGVSMVDYSAGTTFYLRNTTR